MEDCPGLCCGFCRIGCYSLYQVCCCIKAPPSLPIYDVLCLGITGAGKTSLLNVLTAENNDTVIPTIGFIIKDIRLPNAVLKVKELGGGDSVRQHWHRYYNDVHGVIFVVDGSCTHEVLQQTTDALHKAMQNPELSSKPWLILCNKQDLEGACTEERAVEEMKLTSLLHEKESISVTSSSKTNTDGLRITFEKFGNLLNGIYHPSRAQETIGRV